MKLNTKIFISICLLVSLFILFLLISNRIISFEKDLQHFIDHFINNEGFPKYITALQIPFVAAIAITCYTAYKLHLNNYYQLSIAWGFNMVYLIVTTFTIHYQNSLLVFNIGSYIVGFRTMLDLLPICLFIDAVKEKINLEKLRTIQIYFIALIVGLFKILFEGNLQNELFKFNYIPVAVFDLIGIILLGKYFRLLEKENLKDNYLSSSLYLYACIQILAIFNNLPWANNLGFILGTICKILILVLISRLIVYTIRNRSKDQIIAFSKDSKDIVTLRNDFAKTSKNEAKNSIIILTLDKILLSLNKDLGYFALYDQPNEKIQILFTSNAYERQKGKIYSASEGLIGESINTKKISLKRDEKSFSAYLKFGDTNIDQNVKSAIAVPLIFNENIIGVYFVECTQNNCFTEYEVALLDSLVYHASRAIENIELFYENQKLNKDIEIDRVFFDSLKEIDKAIVTKNYNPEPVFKFILNNALSLVNCENGNIDLVTGDNLKCIISTNISNIDQEVEIENCLSGLAVKESKIKVFNDINKLNEHETTLYKDRLGEGYNSELVVPIIVKDEVLGLINIESRHTNVFTSDIIKKVDAFAGQTAIVIYLANLIDEINSKNIELEDTTDKRNIEMAFLFGHQINHKLGNSLGLIRTILKDDLLDKSNQNDYGLLSDNLKNRLNVLLENTEIALKARNDLNENLYSLLIKKPTPIDFIELQRRIETDSYYNSKRNINITISGFETLRPMYLSHILFLEVVNELINNGIKAIDNASGEIRIKAVYSEKELVNIFEFIDNGCGIPIENMANLFVHGFSNWRSGQPGGGIGLNQVNKIVTIFWGGKIEVKSEINKFTSFKLYLPFSKSIKIKN